MTTAFERKPLEVYVEVRTAGGQLLSIRCDEGDVARMKELFAKAVNVRVEEPTAKRTMIPQGGHGSLTRFDVVQHHYAGGGNTACGGYVEILEIKNPPDGRCGFVMHHFDSSRGHQFFEFRTLKEVLARHDSGFWLSDVEAAYQIPGCTRHVICGPFQPWFYAVGDQHIMGDTVFPDHLVEEDAVFRVGRKFVLTDLDGQKTIKTCLGCSHIFSPYKDGWGSTDTVKYLLIRWSDGSVWNEYSPRPWIDALPVSLDEIDPGVAAALEQQLGRFDELLTGTRFTIALPGQRELNCSVRKARPKQ